MVAVPRFERARQELTASLGKSKSELRARYFPSKIADVAGLSLSYWIVLYSFVEYGSTHGGLGVLRVNTRCGRLRQTLGQVAANGGAVSARRPRGRRAPAFVHAGGAQGGRAGGSRHRESGAAYPRPPRRGWHRRSVGLRGGVRGAPRVLARLRVRHREASLSGAHLDGQPRDADLLVL